MQIRKLATSFEGLNSSLAETPGQLWCCKNVGWTWAFEVRRSWHQSC